jgi:hypothetical protein
MTTKEITRKGGIRMAITSSSLMRDAGFAHETNDCFVQALQVVLGVPYRDAHGLVKTVWKRNDAKGTYGVAAGMHRVATAQTTLFGYRVFTHSVNTKGVTYRRSMWGTKARALYPTLTDSMHRFRTGRWVICSRSHAFAIIDGVVYDNGVTGPRTRVSEVYEIVASSQVEAREQSARDEYAARMPVNNGGF